MIVNQYNVPFLTHNEFRWLPDCNVGEIYDFSDKDYYVIQFLEGINCTTERLIEAVPEDIRQRVRDKTLTLVLGNHLEAFHRTADAAYAKFVVEMNLPEEQVLLLTSSPNIMPAVRRYASQYNRKEIKVVWARIYEYYAASVEIHNIHSRPIDKRNKTFDKKFISLNRRWRPHRPALVALLACKNLLEKGHISLADCENGNWDHVYPWIMHISHDEELRRLFTENKEKIYNIPPLYVDTETQENNLDTFRFELQPFYENTYFSIVTETPFYTSEGFDNNIHLSEKTFKVISQRHPFLLLDTPHALKALRSIGYKTFSPFINESYDEELNDGKRLMKIVNEVERLCNLQGNDLDNFLVGIQDICEHNYQNLIKNNNVLGRYCVNLN